MQTDTRQKIQQAYSKSGQEYDQVRMEDRRGRLLSEHDIKLFKQMLPDDLAGKKIAEFGAGTGRFTLPMLERGLSVTATDINDAMLSVLQEKIDAGNFSDRCEWRIEDVFNLKFEDASVEFAVCLHVIPRFLTLDDQRAALHEIARTLKPGGRLLFNYRNGKSLMGALYKSYAASPAQIRDILAAVGMTITVKRGKWFLTRGLLNRLPLPLGRLVAAIDRAMFRFLPNRAWDVFVIAEKASTS